MIQQLSVFMENRTGILSAVLDVLKQAEIQLYAISIADTTDYGICRIICDRPADARKALMDAGIAAALSDVCAVELANTPGAAADMVALFAREGLSLAYLYTFLFKERPVMVFRTDDAAKAKNILESGGLCCFKWN